LCLEKGVKSFSKSVVDEMLKLWRDFFI